MFASGDDAPDSAGNLHTNFALAAEGESLTLVWPTVDLQRTQTGPRFGFA